MAGHNKWSKIRHKKAVTDAKKSKIFGKIVRLIAAKSKKSGGNKEDPELRAAIEQAKAVSMPSQNIERAISKGTSGEAETLETITYEAYGPGGCAILIDTLTDNRNRTAAEIRHILTKHNCSVGAPGSASWIFTRKNNEAEPNTTIPLSEEDNKKLEALVSELMDQDDTQEIYTNET